MLINCTRVEKDYKRAINILETLLKNIEKDEAESINRMSDDSDSVAPSKIVDLVFRLLAECYFNFNETTGQFESNNPEGLSKSMGYMERGSDKGCVRSKVMRTIYLITGKLAPSPTNSQGNKTEASNIDSETARIAVGLLHEAGYQKNPMKTE